VYSNHGDTVIYRSTEQRNSPSPRQRRPVQPRREQAPEASFSDRLARLEARVGELEAALAGPRAAGSGRPGRPEPEPKSEAPTVRPLEPEGVRVSMHAGNGVHATVGQIRVEHE